MLTRWFKLDVWRNSDAKIDKVTIDCINPFKLANELAKGVMYAVLEYESKTKTNKK